MRIEFTLNGKPVSTEVGATEFLADVIRRLGLTGTKVGCGIGVCGICTVLVDERPVSSCIYFAACADGTSVMTVEGVAERHPDLVEILVSKEAMQCGICTGGQLVGLQALRSNRRGAGEEEVREYLNGNLCRCTGYQTILSVALEVVARG